MKRPFRQRKVRIAAASGLLATGLLAGGLTAFSAPAVSAASSSVLVMESSPQNAIQDNFNPFVTSSAASLLGATSLIYEPLLQWDVAKPSIVYKWLATAWTWSNGGKTITFTIRPGVKWSNGSPLTAADVAFTFNMLKQYPDVNTQGLQVAGATSSGNQATVNFSSPQYTNLQDIASQVYIVPQSIWGSLSGDPSNFTDTSPVGSGPYMLDTFTPQGITLKANPSYWGGAPKVSEVDLPVLASNNTVLSELQTNQLDWAGNFLTGLKQTFLNTSSHHKAWFAPVNTNVFFPNLHQWPTNQLAVRQAVSLAIDRTAISQQGESGLEPAATNASGIVLPNFANMVAPEVKTMTLSAHSNARAAKSVLEKAGFVMGKDGYFHTKAGKLLAFNITDPASYSDYAEDDTLAAQALRKAGLDVHFVGQSVSQWGADVAAGTFQMTQHWSETSVSPYQLYNNWLNSALATKNGNGNFEHLHSRTVNADLAALAKATTVKAQLAALAPIEEYVATQLPVIPTVYGAAFDEYNDSGFTGWPSATNPYESGSPNAPTNEVVVLHLRPTS